MKEAQIQTLLGKKLRKSKITGAIELKITKTNTLNFKRIEEHQLFGLSKVKHGTLYWKISDIDPRVKFADCIVMHKQEAYLGICFYKPRKPKIVYLIDIDDVLVLKEDLNKKSITLDDAKLLGKTIEL